MSHDDESFFREVDEDYRREQAIKFFKDYGAYFIAGAFVILALAGGYSLQQSRRASQAAAGGDALTNAMLLSEAGKQDDAQKALASLADSGRGAYRVVARLHAAAESVEKNQLDAARADYRSVAGDGTAPRDLREFAQIQLASLSVDKEGYETLARDLGPLRSGTSRWRFAAKEILGLTAFRESRMTDAERLFSELASDGEAPQGVRERARIVLELLLQKQKTAQAGDLGKKDAANDAKTQ